MFWALFVAWNIIGWLLLTGIGSQYTLGTSTTYRMLNPVIIYDHHRVNVFGAIMIALAYNLMCPVITIVYWFYKLCTVGRK